MAIPAVPLSASLTKIAPTQGGNISRGGNFVDFSGGGGVFAERMMRARQETGTQSTPLIVVVMASLAVLAAFAIGRRS